MELFGGDTDETDPKLLYSIFDATAAWKRIVEALRNRVPGWAVGYGYQYYPNARLRYRRSSRNRLFYSSLEEKEIKYVANATRKDVKIMPK